MENKTAITPEDFRKFAKGEVLEKYPTLIDLSMEQVDGIIMMIQPVIDELAEKEKEVERLNTMADQLITNEVHFSAEIEVLTDKIELQQKQIAELKEKEVRGDRRLVEIEHSLTKAKSENSKLVDVVKELMNTYVIDLDQDGQIKSSISDVMGLLKRASSLLSNTKEPGKD